MADDNYQHRPMTQPLDFTPRPSAAFSATFAAFLDASIKTKRQAERAEYEASDPNHKRPAIGAGRLGNECLRAIAYEFHRTPKERPIEGRTYRIFDRGHVMEEKMAEYLRGAGFTVLTENAKGRQFRYDIAPYEDGKGRIKGMIDGVITAGPEFININGAYVKLSYPMMWENKELGDKGWKKLDKLGLRAYPGDYFPQVQMGMWHLNLADNPALFTAKNANDQHIYAELVAADAQMIQATIDKGVRVVSTNDPEEMPRVAAKATDFRCKFCDYQARCWATKAVTPEAPASAWSFGARG